MAVVFDTHTWIKRLKEAGFTEEQAEAEVSLVTEALTARLETLATKQDLRELEARLEARLKETEGRLDVRMTRLEADMTWLKRLAWAILGAAAVQLLKSFGVL